jgi:RimJ/RimL family protein N-acetyltransferase
MASDKRTNFMDDGLIDLAFEDKFLISRRLPPLEIEYKDSDYHFILRPFYPDDLQQFQSVLIKTLPSMKQFMSWPVKQWDEKDCLLWLTEKHGGYFAGQSLDWGCFDCQTGNFISWHGFMQPITENPGCLDAGTWISITEAKKGYATIVNKAIFAFLFECYNIQRMQAVHLEGHIATSKVVEKMGFKYEGKLRGIYSVPTKEEVKSGIDKVETALLYSMLYIDYYHTSWRQDILNRITVLSQKKEKFNLAEMIS